MSSNTPLFISEDELRQSLRSRVEQTQKAINDYMAAVQAVQAVAQAPRPASPADIMRDSIQNWIDETCRTVSERIPNRSHLTLTAPMLPLPFRAWIFPSGHHIRQNEGYESTGKWVTETLNVRQLCAELNQAVATIEARGFREAANFLASHLGLTVVPFRGRDCVRVRKQKGRHLLSVNVHATGHHEHIRYFKNGWMPVAQTFERESGAAGLSSCIEAIIDVWERQPTYSLVPGRTRVNTKGSVEAVLFKEKFTLHLPPSTFEALIAFITAYSSHDLCALEVA